MQSHPTQLRFILVLPLCIAFLFSIACSKSSNTPAAEVTAVATATSAEEIVRSDSAPEGLDSPLDTAMAVLNGNDDGTGYPAMVRVEEYLHQDVEGKPCHLLLFHAQDNKYYAYSCLSDAFYRYGQEALDSYSGSMDTEEDICLYLLWISSNGVNPYLNDMEQVLPFDEEAISALNNALPQATAVLQEEAAATRESLFVFTELPEALLERRLTDAQLTKLKHADLSTLRNAISTPGDFIAWLDTIGTAYFSNITSNESGQRTLGSSFAMNWYEQMLGSSITVSLAMGILGDDFPNMAIVAAAMDYDTGVLVCGNLLPFGGEQYLVSFDRTTQVKANSFAMEECFPTMVIHDLDEIVTYCGSSQDIACPSGILTQAFLIEKDQPIILENTPDGFLPEDRDGFVEFYRNDAWFAGFEERTYGHIKPENIQSYQLASLLGGVTLTAEEAYELLTMPPEAVRDRVHTAGDVLMYMLAARVADCGGDLQKEVNGEAWHYNLNAKEVMEQHRANCGASANLARYLLDGDYEEIGFILHAYYPGNGGGHVYNYIRQDGKTYIVDFSWYIFGDYRVENDFPVMVLNDLSEYGFRVQELYDGVCMVLAHTSNGQHYPNIFREIPSKGQYDYCIPSGTSYTLLYQDQSPDCFHLTEEPLNKDALNWEIYW